VEWLIKHGAAFDMTDSYGQTLLHYASRGNEQSLEIILKQIIQHQQQDGHDQNAIQSLLFKVGSFVENSII
jgi:hypothetical protein